MTPRAIVIVGGGGFDETDMMCGDSNESSLMKQQYRSKKYLFRSMMSSKQACPQYAHLQ
jgi:hypothetical protein